jgi:hypothetical protein
MSGDNRLLRQPKANDKNAVLAKANSTDQRLPFTPSRVFGAAKVSAGYRDWLLSPGRNASSVWRPSGLTKILPLLMGVPVVPTFQYSKAEQVPNLMVSVDTYDDNLNTEYLHLPWL